MRLVVPEWEAWQAPLRRYLAAKAFANWTAYQGRGVLSIVRGLEAALAFVRVEAARQCRNAGRPLDAGAAKAGVPRRRLRAQPPGGRRGSRVAWSSLVEARSKTATTGPWSLVPTSRWTTQDVARAASDVRGEHVVEPPADIPLLHVAPRRPPREQVGVVGLELAVHVDEAAAEDPLDQRALFRKLSDRARLPLLRMHVHVGPRDVQVAAQDERQSRGLKLGGVARRALRGTASSPESPCRRSARRSTRPSPAAAAR